MVKLDKLSARRPRDFPLFSIPHRTQKNRSFLSISPFSLHTVDYVFALTLAGVSGKELQFRKKPAKDWDVNLL